MRKTIAERLAEHAQKTPNALAAVDAGGSMDYKTLWERAQGFAFYLREACGLKKGGRVAIRASQTIGYIVCYMGTHLAGGVFVPAEKGATEEGFRRIVRDVAASVVIGAARHEGDAAFIDAGDVASIAAAHSGKAAPCPFPSLEDSADILYTTGTTGLSKGVEISHGALAATAENYICGTRMRKDTALIVPCPVSHAMGIRRVFAAIANGSMILLLDGMASAKAFFDALDFPQGPVACCLPPAMLRILFRLTGEKIGEYDGKIDFIESSTSPLPEADKERLRALLPRARLYNHYGSSEAASLCMYDYSEYPGRASCVGKPLPNSQIAIVDGGRNVIRSSKDNLGTLACMGETLMKGYWGDEALTRSVLAGGAVYTNDVGYIDEEGFVYVIGRKDDVINVGGIKVAPEEVEAAALSYEGVADCICVPADDAVAGKALKLCVVPSSAGFDANGLCRHLGGRLESGKLPKQIVLIERVPRTYNGKIDRKNAAF